MRALMQDFSYGMGILRKNPGYAVTAILFLALGIAANTVFFTIFDTFFLHQLPVEQPEQLVQIRSANAIQTGTMWGSASNTYSYPLYQDLQESSHPFSGIACRSHRVLNLNVLGLAATIAVSSYLKSMLFGVQPADPITLSLTVALIGAVALIAALIPARRAAAVDPMTALRSE